MMGDDVDMSTPPGSPARRPRSSCPPTANAYAVAAPFPSSSRRSPYPPPTLALFPPTPPTGTRDIGRSLRVSVSERPRRRRPTLLDDEDEDERRRLTPRSPLLLGLPSLSPTSPLSPISGFEASPPSPDGSSASASLSAPSQSREGSDHDPETSPCGDLDCPRGCAKYNLIRALEAERETVARLQLDLANEQSAHRTAQGVAEHMRTRMDEERAARLDAEARADRAANGFEWYAQMLERERNQWAHEKGQLLAMVDRFSAENKELRERAGHPPREVPMRSARGIVMGNPNEPDGWVRVGAREEAPPVYWRRFNSAAEADAYDAEMARRVSQPGSSRRLGHNRSAPSSLCIASSIAPAPSDSTSTSPTVASPTPELASRPSSPTPSTTATHATVSSTSPEASPTTHLPRTTSPTPADIPPPP